MLQGERKKQMKKYKKLILFFIILAMGYLLNRRFELIKYLKDYNKIQQLVGENYLKSVLIYLVVAIVGSSVLALPGVTFAILSTGMFGPLLGSVYCLVGTTLGATVSFLLSRYLLKDTVEDLVVKNERLYDILFKLDSEREVLILMITRLLPIFPFNLQNFAYGITNISIVKYIVCTFIFMIPGVILFSFGMEGLINSNNRKNMFSLAMVILFIIVFLGIILYKKYKNMIVEDKYEG